MSGTRQTVVRVAIEVLIYAILVSIYLAIVLNFFVGWLQELFAKQRALYAFLTILLMIAQAIVFERVAAVLVNPRWHRRVRFPK
jgi:predicted PurR-regulated permease PerM